jgi:hypothetical protein
MAPAIALAGLALIVVALLAYVAVAVGGGDPVLTDSDDHGDQSLAPWRLGGSGEQQKRRGQ